MASAAESTAESAVVTAAECGRLLASPIFGSVHDVLAELASATSDAITVLNRASIARDVRTAGGRLVQFVAPPASRRAFADQYEVRIHERGEVATRTDNWHDLFNALVWLAFPRTKACLNAHHFRELSANFGAALRGTARDVLTLFDEGGIIVATSDPSVGEGLRAHQWKALFWHEREALMRSTRFLVFGHAILEKAIAPFAGVTAKALVLDVSSAMLSVDDAAFRAQIDLAASAYFARPEALISTRALGALPILGIPDWTPENACPDYYDDVRQFRPLGARRTRPEA